MDEMTRTIRDLCRASEERRIRAVVKTAYGDYYIYACREEDGEVTLSGVGPYSTAGCIHTGLSFENAQEGELCGVEYSGEWIGRTPEDRILYEEECFVMETIRMHVSHRHDKEAIMDDPFLYV